MSLDSSKWRVNSVGALMTALAQQPVSVAMEADSVVFQYLGGAMQFCGGTKLDHGVLAVGYGTDGSTDYWKVNNSWGATWSEVGSFRLLRGKGNASKNAVFCLVHPLTQW